MKVGELLNTSNWFELERVYPALAADVQTPMLKQMSEVMLPTSTVLQSFARNFRSSLQSARLNLALRMSAT